MNAPNDSALDDEFAIIDARESARIRRGLTIHEELDALDDAEDDANDLVECVVEVLHAVAPGASGEVQHVG